jgi:nitrogen-specific signal transduction histidine kinase
MNVEIIINIIAEHINTPILFLIIIILFVEWKNFNNTGFNYLFLGWLVNLIYIYTESNSLTMDLDVRKLLQAIKPLLALINIFFFFMYILKIKKPEKKYMVLFYVLFIVFFLYSFYFTYINYDLIDPSLKIIHLKIFYLIYTPIILISVICILFVAFSLWNYFSFVGRGLRLSIFLPYIFYGILQFFYFFANHPNKTYMAVAFLFAIIIKIAILCSLIWLFYYETNIFNKQKADLEYKEQQIIAFRWFAHELKNPILVIRSISQSILNYIKEYKYSNASSNVHSLNKSVDLLANVVENVKLAAEPIDPENFSLILINDVIQESIKIIKIAYSIEGNKIATDFASELYVKANKGNLVQIFVNLLKNAYEASCQNEKNIKSLSEDSFKVAVKTRKTLYKNSTYVSITVSDYGPGIPPNHIKKIFDPYFSTKEGINRGMGLYICDRLINGFNGRINAISPIYLNSYGSMFEILLPFHIKEQ